MKVAFITGGMRGIGLGTARALYSRGYAVVLADLDLSATEAAAAELGEHALGLEADVTDRASLDAAVTAAVERFGGIDVVVANAGIAPDGQTTRVFDDDVFQRVIDVNLMGVWHTIRATLPHVIERRGHLLLISSIYAFTNGLCVTPYAASKAAVEQLGRALRAELAPHGATAGVAYFGFVDTEMVRVGLADPIGAEFEKLIPRPLRKKISPTEAGEVLARSIERRAPRVIAPRRWGILSALRGLINPLIDARMARDPRLQELVKKADVEGRVPTKVA